MPALVMDWTLAVLRHDDVVEGVDVRLDLLCERSDGMSRVERTKAHQNVRPVPFSWGNSIVLKPIAVHKLAKICYH